MNRNDILDTDGNDYILIPTGEQIFTVTHKEFDQYPGSANLPPCEKVIITLAVDMETGRGYARVDIPLCTSMKWKLAAFFRSIGLKKHGEAMKMDWNLVEGRQGAAIFETREYQTRSGQTRTINSVASFLDYDPRRHMTQVEMDDQPF